MNKVYRVYKISVVQIDGGIDIDTFELVRDFDTEREAKSYIKGQLKLVIPKYRKGPSSTPTEYTIVPVWW